MRRIIASLIFLILFTIPAIAQNIKVAGIASKGGKIVRTSAQVQHTLMETYPTSTVTVYLTGTLTLASIFSDEIGTAKANPFTANTDASWYFYIAEGRYDIKFSGTGILVPFTLSDIFVNEGGGGGGGVVSSVFGRTGAVVAIANDYTWAQIDKSTSSLADITTRSASDLSSGTLPDARFPATLPAISGANLTNLNAANLTGTIDDARLSSNIPRKNTVNTFTQDNIFMSNVGINTSTPRRRLDVLDPSNPQLRLSVVDNSTFADFFVDSGGTLNISPTGNTTFDSVGNQVNPLNNFDQNLGQINKKWLSLHAAELFVETLVAQNTIATIGGRIIVAPTNILIVDLSSASGTINVKYNNLASGDIIYFEGNTSVEFMVVTSGASVISGGFSYSVTRNLDGTGANDWFAGDAMVNTGVSGDGFIDLYSVRGVKSATQPGPTIVGNVRNSTTFNDWTENWAIGNINGLYGYGSDTYAVGLGKYAAGTTHITIDATNGIRFFNGLSTVSGLWDTSGNIILGEVAVGRSNILLSASLGAIKIRNNITDHIQIDSGGVLVGVTGSGLSNIQILSGGQINIRNNTTNRISLTSAGIMTINDSGGNAVLTFDAATGAEITKKLTMPGTSSAIAIGVTPPTSATVGTGLYLDRTGLYGLASNVLQIKLDAVTGDFLAGEVTIDAAGISLETVTTGGKGATDTSTRIKWLTSGGVNVGEIVGHRAGTTSLNIIEIWGKGETGTDTRGEVLLTASSDNTEVNAAYFRVKAEGPDSRTFMSFSGTANFKGISVGVAGSPVISGTGPSLDIWSDTVRLRNPRTPASAGATCNEGEISWDTGFVYVCTATNTWKRAAIATW